MFGDLPLLLPSYISAALRRGRRWQPVKRGLQVIEVNAYESDRRRTAREDHFQLRHLTALDFLQELAVGRVACVLPLRRACGTEGGVILGKLDAERRQERRGLEIIFAALEAEGHLEVTALADHLPGIVV